MIGKRKNIIWLLVGIVICPIFVAFMMIIESPVKLNVDNDWIGFYASYIGSIIGVLGVYLVMRIDKLQRDKERKDEMFLKNIDIYRNINHVLNQGHLFKISDKISEIKKSSDWLLIDTKTKYEIGQIIAFMSESDERYGYIYAIRNFVERNLYDEMKVTLNHNVPGSEEVIEYDDLSFEIIEGVVSILYKNSNNPFDHDDEFGITISKEKLFNEFEKDNYTKGYKQNFDDIYSIILSFNTSIELYDFKEKRNYLLMRIAKLRKNIELRIEKVLSY